MLLVLLYVISVLGSTLFNKSDGQNWIEAGSFWYKLPHGEPNTMENSVFHAAFVNFGVYDFLHKPIENAQINHPLIELLREPKIGSSSSAVLVDSGKAKDLSKFTFALFPQSKWEAMKNSSAKHTDQCMKLNDSALLSVQINAFHDAKKSKVTHSTANTVARSLLSLHEEPSMFQKWRDYFKQRFMQNSHPIIRQNSESTEDSEKLSLTSENLDSVTKPKKINNGRNLISNDNMNSDLNHSISCTHTYKKYNKANIELLNKDGYRVDRVLKSSPVNKKSKNTKKYLPNFRSYFSKMKRPFRGNSSYFSKSSRSNNPENSISGVSEKAKMQINPTMAEPNKKKIDSNKKGFSKYKKKSKNQTIDNIIGNEKPTKSSKTDHNSKDFKAFSNGRSRGIRRNKQNSFKNSGKLKNNTNELNHSQPDINNKRRTKNESNLINRLRNNSRSISPRVLENKTYRLLRSISGASTNSWGNTDSASTINWSYGRYSPRNYRQPRDSTNSSKSRWYSTSVRYDQLRNKLKSDNMIPKYFNKLSSSRFTSRNLQRRYRSLDNITFKPKIINDFKQSSQFNLNGRRLEESLEIHPTDSLHIFEHGTGDILSYDELSPSSKHHSVPSHGEIYERMFRIALPENFSTFNEPVVAVFIQCGHKLSLKYAVQFWNYGDRDVEHFSGPEQFIPTTISFWAIIMCSIAVGIYVLEYSHKNRHNSLSQLVRISLGIQAFRLLFETLHLSRVADNGIGYRPIAVVCNILFSFNTAFVILMLVLSTFLGDFLVLGFNLPQGPRQANNLLTKNQFEKLRPGFLPLFLITLVLAVFEPLATSSIRGFKLSGMPYIFSDSSIISGIGFTLFALITLVLPSWQQRRNILLHILTIFCIIRAITSFQSSRQGLYATLSENLVHVHEGILSSCSLAAFICMRSALKKITLPHGLEVTV